MDGGGNGELHLAEGAVGGLGVEAGPGVDPGGLIGAGVGPLAGPAGAAGVGWLVEGGSCAFGALGFPPRLMTNPILKAVSS